MITLKRRAHFKLCAHLLDNIFKMHGAKPRLYLAPKLIQYTGYILVGLTQKRYFTLILYKDTTRLFQNANLLSPALDAGFTKQTFILARYKVRFYLGHKVHRHTDHNQNAGATEIKRHVKLRY